MSSDLKNLIPSTNPAILTMNGLEAHMKGACTAVINMVKQAIETPNTLTLEICNQYLVSLFKLLELDTKFENGCKQMIRRLIIKVKCISRIILLADQTCYTDCDEKRKQRIKCNLLEMWKPSLIRIDRDDDFKVLQYFDDSFYPLPMHSSSKLNLVVNIYLHKPGSNDREFLPKIRDIQNKEVISSNK
jgi:hypothetical protein